MQACLGATAKEGERNVVEVTADDEDGEEVTHAILSMRVGGTEQVWGREREVRKEGGREMEQWKGEEGWSGKEEN